MSMGMGMGSSKSSKSKRNIVVWYVLLMGLLLAEAAKGDKCTDYCIREGYTPRRQGWLNCYYNCRFPGGGGAPRLHLKRFSAGEARGAMVAKGGLPAVRVSVCDMWCEDVHPDVNHRLCIQNLCPYDKIPKHFSAGEARGAMVAKGGQPVVRFSVCDVWCEDVHPNMNHRLCVQNLCPYDKTPKFKSQAKLTSDDLLSA